jgi:ABC-type transporter Mla subunit MlaD
MTERQPARLPAHVFVMLSASTATYALALAVVAGVQSADEAALTASRDPVARAVAELAAGHDELGDRLDRARAVYAQTAQQYAAAGGSIGTLETSLGALSTTVAAIDGVSRSLPSRVRLPSVAGAVSGGRAPATHGTTGASGG